MATSIPHRTWVEVDLSALQHNIERIRQALPAHVQIIGVVKANADGHGMDVFAKKHLENGIKHFAVATLAEAISLRNAGIHTPILVFGAILPGEEPYFADYNLSATVSCADELLRLSHAGVRSSTPIHIHLKIDTGLGRLGCLVQEAPALYQQILKTPFIQFAGAFTHFAVAAADEGYTHAQREAFFKALSQMPGINPKDHLLHADNSAGIATFPKGETLLNAVRIGISQFGFYAQKEGFCHNFYEPLGLNPIISFHTSLGLIKRLPAGAGIGYGLKVKLKRPSIIGVITAGYADGVPPHLSPEASVLVNGKPCPILGSVCMDQCMVDLTDLSVLPNIGDRVTLIGSQGESTISLHDWVHWSGHGAHAILCGIGPRVERVYK